MNKWRRMQLGLAITVAACLGIMILQPAGTLVSLISALWVAAAIWLLLRSESRMRQAEHDALLIRTINHHRHDWMNDLQVLFGYIGLRKYDIVPVYVDKIKAKVVSESGISKLGIPSLIVYLLSFRVNKRRLVLEVDIEQEIALPTLPLDADEAAAVICDTIELYDRMAKEPDEYSDEGNVLSFQLELDDDSLLLDFVYNGRYESALEAKLRAHLAQRAITRDAELDFSERRAVVTIRIPLQT